MPLLFPKKKRSFVTIICQMTMLQAESYPKAAVENKMDKKIVTASFISIQMQFLTNLLGNFFW